MIKYKLDNFDEGVIFIDKTIDCADKSVKI